ncbi:MAG: hypothetical protein ACU0D1_19550 [Pseudooceanicola nanhaiensis]
MSKRFVLHIGANKTGTSSIQRMLFENRAALEEAGWCYPDFELMHMAHHRLAYSIAEDPYFSLGEGWKARFRQAVADRDRRYVISSELFFRVVPPLRVARFFPPEETQVVLYLRDHLSYMMSWYAQAVQERNLTASFSDYVQIFQQPFSGFLHRWENAYGAENIRIRPFLRDQLVGQDSRRDFLEVLDGVDPDHLALGASDSNLTISGNLLFFKKILNNYMTFEEATSPPITDEIGAFAEVAEGFRGRFRAGREETAMVKRVFGGDIRKLAEKGVVFPPMPEEVAGNPVPNLDTLKDDIRLIKRIATETDKVFLRYAARWQDWHDI